MSTQKQVPLCSMCLTPKKMFLGFQYWGTIQSNYRTFYTDVVTVAPMGNLWKMQRAIQNFDYWDYVAPEPNLNEMVFEEQSCRNLIQMLERCLSKSKQTRLHCSKVLVPEKLTKRIAQDILRLSSTEPCGIKGCIIHVNLEMGNVCKKLDKIVCDSTVVPTFELTLVFKQDSCSWLSFRNFFPRACFMSGSKRTLILSPGFRLIKEKLYSVGTTIEEC